MDAKKPTKTCSINYGGINSGCEFINSGSTIIGHELKDGVLLLENNVVVCWEGGSGSFVMGGYLYKKDSNVSPYTKSAISDEDILKRIEKIQDLQHPKSDSRSLPRPPPPFLPSLPPVVAAHKPVEKPVGKLVEKVPAQNQDWKKTPYHVLSTPIKRSVPRKSKKAQFVVQEPKAT
jgi:hypothetical protein